MGFSTIFSTRSRSRAARAGLHDAVLVGLRMRHGLHGHDAAVVEAIAHLLEAGLLGVDEVVGEVHEERRIAHRGLGAQHGVAQAQRRGLADVDAGGVGGQHALEHLEQIALALLQQQVFEFAIGIEVIFDGALGRTGDEHQAPRTGCQRLFHRILNEWLVDDGQHLFGAGLGGRQESGSSSGDRKNGNVDAALLAVSSTAGILAPAQFRGRNHTTPRFSALQGNRPGHARVCATSRLSRPRVRARVTTRALPAWRRAARRAARPRLCPPPA